MTLTQQGEDWVLQLFDKAGTEYRLVVSDAQVRAAKAALAELADVAAEQRSGEEEEKQLEEEEAAEDALHEPEP